MSLVTILARAGRQRIIIAKMETASKRVMRISFVNFRLPLILAMIAASGCAKSVARFATVDASLSRSKPGQLLLNLSRNDDAQLKAVAGIVQRAAPDVLLLEDVDFDS